MCKQNGLTLTELCLTLAIASIVLSIGMPAMSQLRDSQRLVSSTNSLIHALQLTRMYAISTRQAHVLCPSSQPIECTKNTDWTSGWSIHPALSGDTPQLSFTGQPSTGVRIQTTVGRTQVRYNPDGTSPGTNATFTVCNQAGTHRVVINNTGRVRSERNDNTC